MEDRYVAYCLDQVTGLWGTHVEREVEAVDHKNPKTAASRKYSKLLELLDAPKNVRYKSLKQSRGGG